MARSSTTSDRRSGKLRVSSVRARREVRDKRRGRRSAPSFSPFLRAKLFFLAHDREKKFGRDVKKRAREDAREVHLDGVFRALLFNYFSQKKRRVKRVSSQLPMMEFCSSMAEHATRALRRGNRAPPPKREEKVVRSLSRAARTARVFLFRFAHARAVRAAAARRLCCRPVSRLPPTTVYRFVLGS